MACNLSAQGGTSICFFYSFISLQPASWWRHRHRHWSTQSVRWSAAPVGDSPPCLPVPAYVAVFNAAMTSLALSFFSFFSFIIIIIFSCFLCAHWASSSLFRWQHAELFFIIVFCTILHHVISPAAFTILILATTPTLTAITTTTTTSFSKMSDGHC